jgi:hypothetical protein
LNGNLGAGTSAPTWSNDGKFGKALSFDGNDYVQTIMDWEIQTGILGGYGKMVL